MTQHRRSIPAQPGRGAWLRRVTTEDPRCVPLAEAVAGTPDGLVDFDATATRLGIPESELFRQLARLERHRLARVLPDGTIRRTHGMTRPRTTLRPTGRNHAPQHPRTTA